MQEACHSAHRLDDIDRYDLEILLAGEGQQALRVGALAEPNTQDLSAGDYVRIFVADTSSGMDSKTLARAVEPFYTTKGGGRGTGLDCRWCIASRRSPAAALP